MPNVRARCARLAAALLALLACLLHAPGAAAALSAVEDCQPCAIDFPDGATLELRFVWHAAGDDTRVLRGIMASRTGGAIQTLPVKDMPARAADERVILGVLQVPDGSALLGLVLGTGSANSMVQYWRYVGSTPKDPGTRPARTASLPFRDLGVFPYLQVDPRNGRLFGREVGGHGGRDYSRREYVLAGNTLRAVREETQRFEPTTDTYRRTVREWRAGRWHVLSDQRLDPADLATPAEDSDQKL